MPQLNATDLIRGPDAPTEPARVDLRCGAVSAQLRGIDLAHVVVDGLDVARLVYGAVRDVTWDTIQPSVKSLEIRRGPSSFDVMFEAVHRAGDLVFDWRGRIEGSPDGVITYELDGVLERSVSYARIGLCIHHAVSLYQGCVFSAALGQDTFSATFPDEIAPQFFANGVYAPAVPPFKELQVDLAPGYSVVFAFEGDEFEIEDQRNWTDATFKTYSTPLSLGQVHTAKPGERIRQRVTIAVRRCAERPRRWRRRAVETTGSAEVALRIGNTIGGTFPPIGSVWPADSTVSTVDVDLLTALHLAHIRIDLDLENESRSVTAGRIELGCGVEAAVWVTPSTVHRLPDAIEAAGALGRVERVIVIDSRADVVDPALVALARGAARDAGLEVPVGGGSDYWFAEVNRSPMDFRDLDFLAFSITPQLHVFDDESIFESLAVQATVTKTAAARVRNGSIVVSPITITARDSEAARQGHVQPLDGRQPSLFAAAWTAASIGVLAEAGVASATYVDTAGLGLAFDDRVAGRWTGRAFPLYHVIAAACRQGGQPLIPVHTTDADRVRAFAVEAVGGRSLTVVNCTPHAQRPVVRGLSPGTLARLLRLDESSVVAAVDDPGRFDQTAVTVQSNDGTLSVPLGPYGVAWLDLPATCMLSS